jgi:Tat protein secretion system quality control protein TatD with DNase activity
MILVDSHCHIDGEQFDADREQVIENVSSGDELK